MIYLLQSQQVQIRQPMSSTSTEMSCPLSSWERLGCWPVERFEYGARRSCRPQPTETGFLEQTISLATLMLCFGVR